MGEADIYFSIRSEIVSNHVLMHWLSIVVVMAILLGTWIVESRKTILSVFLPLLALAWAASMVRFDFFIHRQAAYLRAMEPQLRAKGLIAPVWETWKLDLRLTPFILPVADVIICLVIVLPTVYLLFGPAQQFFKLHHWKGGEMYAWTITILMVLLLCSLAVIPQISGWR